MKAQKQLVKRKLRRKFRVSNRVRRDAHGRPRLSVFKSNLHIYAQIIDDSSGTTLCAASTLDASISGPGKPGSNCDKAAEVGKLIGSKAKEKGITTVVFDRGGSRYHGRIASLADAARAEGLEF